MMRLRYILQTKIIFFQQMRHGSPPHSGLAESLLGSGFLGR